MILILEDDVSRIDYFRDRFKLTDVFFFDNSDEAIDFLSKKISTFIFLDNDLGDHAGSGIEVARFLSNHKENKNNNASIVVHSWNTPAATTIIGLLPRAYFFPYGSRKFFNYINFCLDNIEESIIL